MRTGGNSPRPPDPSDLPPSTTSPTRQYRTTRATPPNSRCHSPLPYSPVVHEEPAPSDPTNPPASQPNGPAQHVGHGSHARSPFTLILVHTLIESPHAPQTDKPAH